MTIDVEKLRTDRVVLREFRESAVWQGSDAQQLAVIAQHPKFQGFFAFPPKGSPTREFRKAAKALVVKAIRFRRPYKRTHQRENYKLAITRPTDPEKIIGYVALDEINEARGEYRDIGFFIHPDFQSQGYATEASRIVLKAFFEFTRYNEIYVTYHPANIASKKIVEKHGYQKLKSEYYLMVNGKNEPREKCILTRKNFYAKLSPVSTL
jgi:RimJ/RimL family protein N-acetyltransferase